MIGLKDSAPTGCDLLLLREYVERPLCSCCGLQTMTAYLRVSKSMRLAISSRRRLRDISGNIDDSQL